LEVQETEKQKKSLSRSNIELSFQRATRGDEGNTLQSTLSRGEYLETFLRIVKHFHQSEKKISMFIKDVIDEYIEPYYKRSKIPETRKLIQNHK